MWPVYTQVAHVAHLGAWGQVRLAWQHGLIHRLVVRCAELCLVIQTTVFLDRAQPHGLIHQQAASCAGFCLGCRMNAVLDRFRSVRMQVVMRPPRLFCPALARPRARTPRLHPAPAIPRNRSHLLQPPPHVVRLAACETKCCGAISHLMYWGWTRTCCGAPCLSARNEPERRCSAAFLSSTDWLINWLFSKWALAATHACAQQATELPEMSTRQCKSCLAAAFQQLACWKRP